MKRKPGQTRKKDTVLEPFLPCVRQWFSRSFEGPSPPQVKAWPAIRRGENTLLLAPTGSGKTLAAFLCAIDELVRRGREGELSDGVHVLYISPLKALGNDIHRNLLEPLAGIRKAARGRIPEIRVAVRTGDTPQSEREKMIRTPPHILITTPESLFLLLAGSKIAPALGCIRTVIVDEVHSLCDNKRGVHLALSLERLAQRTERPFQRVGCSATISPLNEIAAYLVGYDQDGKARPCTIVNAGMRKHLDVQVTAPLADFLEASNTALWASAYELLLAEIKKHDTTLIFCNSRYKAERTALRLKELAGDRVRIGVHHGSMSKETRLRAEEDLKSGRLDALVATTSLELGIDVGSVDLVYQLESPKSVATGLQRIGRAGHLLGAMSKGRILVFERDELVEAAAICRSMVEGAIDDVHLPRNCLDVLAQQIAGAVAYGDRQADELFSLVRQAYPYAALERDDFDRVLGMLAGEYPFEMPRPPRPLILWDRATGNCSAARGSKPTVAMNVGTIGESSEYNVLIQGTKKRVGKVQSGFVDDCLRTKDIFVLGSTSWQVMGKRKDTLLVKEAPGSTPTVPWWLGPVPPRTSEVGERVGVLRREVASRLESRDVTDWLQSNYLLSPDAATAVSDYVREQDAAAKIVPDHERLLVETWKDELGRINCVLHCPLGHRINRTWGIALASLAKKRFKQDWSVTASNDLLLLTFHAPQAPPVHKPDAGTLFVALTPDNLTEFVGLAAAEAIASGSAFRDVATFAFQIPRFERGRRVPLWLQTYRADELFTAAGRCDDYPVIVELRRGYVEESLDRAGLARLLARIQSRELELVFKDVESPSPFAHSLLVQHTYRGEHQMGRDRRAYLLRLHRNVLQKVLSSEEIAELLDARAIQRLEVRLQHKSEVTRARTSDELAAAVRDLGDVPATMEAVETITDGGAADLLRPLVKEHRLVAFEIPGLEEDAVRLVAADLWQEYRDAFQLGGRERKQSLLLPEIRKGAIRRFVPARAAQIIPARWRKKQDARVARRNIVERYLKRRGPVTAYEIANKTGWPLGAVNSLLKELVGAGTVARGVYTSDKPRPQHVNRVNLEDIHRLTMGYLKRELAACAPYEVVDFMTRWQHRHPDTRLEGLEGLRAVVRQLQGFEIVTAGLESEMLAGRVKGYQPHMLDQLIASGEVCWRRVGLHRVTRGKVTLCFRKDAEWLGRGMPVQFDVEQEADEDIRGQIMAVRSYFSQQKTAFFDDVVSGLGLEEGPVMRAVWYLAWVGELTCDTYECLRYSDFSVSLSACYDLDSTPLTITSGRMSADRVIKQMRRRKLDPRLGRWSATERLVPPKRPTAREEIVRRWVKQLLDRWGVVSRDILAAETAAPPWPELLLEFKRLELLGQARRGYFIESHHGEQYGLPEAIDLLRDCRARRGDGHELGYQPDETIFCMTSRDPANLYASSLDIINERGEVFPRAARRGNWAAHVVVQAGQALLYNADQIVTLTREQLKRCIESQLRDPLGHETDILILNWNNYPVDVSPVAPVLWEMGFRFTAQRTMVFPPKKHRGSPPGESTQDIFLPCYEEPAPVSYGHEWTVRCAAEQLRAAVDRMLKCLVRELERAGWKVTWESRGPEATYRDSARAFVYIAKKYALVLIGTRSFRIDGKRYGMPAWQMHEELRVTRPEDVGRTFVAALRRLLAQAQDYTDRFFELRGSAPPI